MLKTSKTTAWDKFVLLSWKNWIIQIRHPVQTTFEILVPIFVCALLAFIRYQAKVTEYDKPFINHPEEIKKINSTIFNESLANSFIFHSPNNTVLNQLMRKVSEDLNLVYSDAYAKANASDLEDASERLNTFASIEFEDDLKVTNFFL